MMIQPQAMLDILSQWCGELAGLHVAIDGKTLRGTHDAELGRHKVHLLRAWVDACSLSAAQVLCEEKSNELEAIPRLLAALQLRGATVTIDAALSAPCGLTLRPHRGHLQGSAPLNSSCLRVRIFRLTQRQKG
jgi:hypothetical protein